MANNSEWYRILSKTLDLRTYPLPLLVLAGDTVRPASVWSTVRRHHVNPTNRERNSLAIARPSAARIAPAQHSARGRAKLHMSLLPVIDPGAIKQHRIAVNYENKSRHVSAALGVPRTA